MSMLEYADMYHNTTLISPSTYENTTDVVTICSIVIASVGILANGNVLAVLGNHRKLRNKVPNIFIINQVPSYFLHIVKFLKVF